MANPYAGGYDNGHQLNDIPGNVRTTSSLPESRLTSRRATDLPGNTLTTKRNIPYCNPIPHTKPHTTTLILDL